MKAREILTSPNLDGLTMIVDNLYTRKQSEDYKTARTLYDLFVSNFPNCLTLKLLKIYLSSSDQVLRLRSIGHLSETLPGLRNRNFKLSLVALHEIKPLLISCLTRQNPRKCDTNCLRVIVSFVAENVMSFYNGRWEELSEYILLLVNQDPIRAFSYFIELPLLYEGFINRFLEKLREEVYKVLLHPEKNKEEAWVLALTSAVKMGIEVSDSVMRREILHNVMKSAFEVMWLGMEREFAIRGLQYLDKYLAKEAKLCKWSSKQCGFVAAFAYAIAGVGTSTKEEAKKIFVMVTNMDKYVLNPAFKLEHFRVDNQDLGVDSDRELYYMFRQCTPMEVLSFFAIPGSDYRSREIAIKRLYDSLCDHTSSQWEIDVSEIRGLQPLLITCLKEEGLPENIYKILGQVVFHVAQETFNYEKDPWFDLWDYIGSESKVEFEKAVYIFQRLTMWLEFKDIVVPAITNLLPEINRNLTPPRELLVDNSRWVLAFTGAYCSAIHLLEVKSHAGYVKEIAYKMIDSVRELVERGMEVGLVTRAFRDLESIVKKQWVWYMTCEYRFLKGLLWRLYAINGMKRESKYVLWRINVDIERSVDENLKVLPKSEFDWLNQPKP
ncbi:unnamed protein product [Arabidopsis thaliana]|uniref:Similarity to unknown protein n=1 Tax=Arabidopsis thaliana TaxID=3702 RepID=Q9FHQ5_ARATH|nr:hypothetical protein (DUF577) [Arabidopsis thaliana]ABE65567.1 hypothetical protein At5g37650 [Arabidopsis thaliana]AED94214.1 hypothetical protein (DUF577) [Arabidopsis thaliana]BAB08311.1 unnamed protein product [Arabidopsis thaliana]|eukprot:NP_198581.1 hypothetical protein (DUF577) [Arabidopsis thaliana]